MGVKPNKLLLHQILHLRTSYATLKRILAIVALVLGGAAFVAAQGIDDAGNHQPAPYWFVGLQGGVQTTFTDYDQFKLLAPTASVSVGRLFTPVVGARLHVNGLWNKGGIKPDFTYNYNYVTTDIDMLINLCTLFGSRTYYPLNLYLIGGIGLNYAWNNDDLNNSQYDLADAWNSDSWSHNARMGVMVGYDLCKQWSVNLEVSANNLNDRYNSKHSRTDDWQLTAQVGIAYRFECKAKPKPEPEPVVAAEPEPEAEPEAEPEESDLGLVRVETDATKPAPVQHPVVQGMRTEIFYPIRQTTITRGEKAKVDNLISFLQNNPDTRVTVTGYADVGTGNPTVNLRYSKGRAEGVAQAIIDGGISADRITVDYKGDTEQPFSENDKNRVTIAVAEYYQR